MGPTLAPTPGLFRVVGDGQYTVAFADRGIEFSVDRLRRERHELHCELSVACGMVGARTVDGVLSVGTFNLSSPAAAQARAKLLAERARANGLDWSGMLVAASPSVGCSKACSPRADAHDRHNITASSTTLEA